MFDLFFGVISESVIPTQSLNHGCCYLSQINTKGVKLSIAGKTLFLQLVWLSLILMETGLFSISYGIASTDKQIHINMLMFPCHMTETHIQTCFEQGAGEGLQFGVGAPWLRLL